MEWQPIETAPKDGNEVLLWAESKADGWSCFEVCYWDEDHREGAWVLDSEGSPSGISRPQFLYTHWMRPDAPR